MSTAKSETTTKSVVPGRRSPGRSSPDASTPGASTPDGSSPNAGAVSLGTAPERLTFAQALGGTWLSRPLIWIIGALPTLALAVILEVSLTDEDWQLIAATGVLQFVAATLILSTTVHLARRLTPIVSVPLAISLLALTAVGQGIVGGIFAELVIGTPANYPSRIGFWLAVQWLWAPLVTNTLAQYEHRRYLLAELAVHVDSWNDNAERGTVILRNQHVRLLETIRSTVSPVTAEIRRQFTGDDAPKEQAEFLNAAEQLTVLSRSVEKILDTPHITTSLALEAPEHPKRFAPILAAMSYEIRRPYASSAVLAMLLLPVLAPGMFRLGGLPAIAELILGVVCSAFLFASGLQLIKLFSVENSRARMAQIVIVHLVASIAAPVVVGSMSWEPLGQREWVVVVILPVGFIFAAVTVSGAFGLGDANSILVDEVNQVRNRFLHFQDFFREEEQRMSVELEALLHGPIRGRLSACIMALKFHADELALTDSARGESILRAVAKHLDATARDLDRMNVPTPLVPRRYADRMKSND